MAHHAPVGSIAPSKGGTVVPPPTAPTAPAAHVLWDEVAAFLAAPTTHGLAGAVVRIDTHAAAVFLAGPRAYKIKRPVRFPFLDFSTLSRREAACRREIAVDRPIAPSIYRGVVAITREPDGRLALGGSGEPVEWAVAMNRFDETATLDHVVARGPLAPAFVADLARTVAVAEARAPRRAVAPWRADLSAYLDQNAEAFALRPDLFPPPRVEALDRLARRRLAALADLLDERQRLGRIRLGHGDLHAGNVAVIDGRPQIFDAIEFDDAVATGDVLYDAAFMVMDLEARGDRAAARLFLDRWLVESVRREAGLRPDRPVAELLVAELDALAALPLWLSIRAALRAKIAAARARATDGVARAAAETEARRFFAVARDRLEPLPPRLVAVAGLSGSGKSTLARLLAVDLDPAPGALVLRTDVLRKLEAGVDDTARLDAAHYTPAASRRIYDHLVAAAGRALAAGRSVVVDAVALHDDERRRFADLAAAVEVPFTGLWLDVDPAIAAARVGARRDDASDADAGVVAFQAGLTPGAIDWPRLDASGTPEATLAAARRALGLPAR